MHGEHRRTVFLIRLSKFKNAVRSCQPPLCRALKLALGNETPAVFLKAMTAFKRGVRNVFHNLANRQLLLGISDNLLFLLDDLR